MKDDRDPSRFLDRRSFIQLTGTAVTTALLGCGSRGPEDAQKVLRWAEGRNEGVERALFRHTSIDRASRSAKLAGEAFPVYYVSKTLPVWDASVRGPWSLEVSCNIHPCRTQCDGPVRCSGWLNCGSANTNCAS